MGERPREIEREGAELTRFPADHGNDIHNVFTIQCSLQWESLNNALPPMAASHTLKIVQG